MLYPEFESRWDLINQNGAVEARWAHNPKVDRSKLSSAIGLDGVEVT